MKNKYAIIAIVAILVVALLIVFNIGGGNKNSRVDKTNRTVEDLLDDYVESYTKADEEIAKGIFPPFYVEYIKDGLSKEKLESSLKAAKERYGDDFTITYKINDKVLLSDLELDMLNTAMQEGYGTEEFAKECYRIEGITTFKGSKEEDPQPISSMVYCKYESGNYLIGF